MAQFVVHLNFKPEDYWNLTVYERDAIIEAFNKANRKR